MHHEEGKSYIETNIDERESINLASSLSELPQLATPQPAISKRYLEDEEKLSKISENSQELSQI